MSGATTSCHCISTAFANLRTCVCGLAKYLNNVNSGKTGNLIKGTKKRYDDKIFMYILKYYKKSI